MSLRTPTRADFERIALHLGYGMKLSSGIEPGAYYCHLYPPQSEEMKESKVRIVHILESRKVGEKWEFWISDKIAGLEVVSELPKYAHLIYRYTVKPLEEATAE